METVKTHVVLVADLKDKLPSRVRRIVLHDNLLVGPCREAFEEHITERTAYLRAQGEQNVRTAYIHLANAMTTSHELVVWSCDAWPQHVALAMICSLRLRQPNSPRISVIELALRAQSTGTCCGVPAVPTTVAEMRALIPRNLTDSDLLQFSSVWARFVARDPARFLGTGSGVISNADALRALYEELFPRRRFGVLHLSRFDELLLSAARESLTPADLVVGKSTELVMLRRWVSCAGDSFVARRLWDWSEHPSGAPALLADPMDRSGSMFRMRYSLTATGRSMLDDRLQRFEDAPVLRVGGTAAYDPAWPYEIEDQ